MNKVLEQLKEQWKRLSGGQKASVIAATILVPVLIAALTAYSNRPTWEPLPLRLDQQGMANIVGFLDSNGFDYVTEGNLVKVPKNQKFKILAALGQAGIDYGDSDGWSLLDGLNLSMSSKQLDLTTLRIYQKWMESTLRSFDFLSDASVVLTPAGESVFALEKDRKRAKASVMATTRMGARLNASQVQAIVNVVTSGVSGLEPGCVSVQDRSGFVYRTGNNLDEELPGWGLASSGLDLDQRQSKLFTRLLNDHLQRIFGPGKTTASVTVVLDHTQILEQAKDYDPDGQVFKKKTSREDESSVPKASGAVGATANLPANSTAKSTTSPEEKNKTSEKTTEYLSSEKSSKTLRANPEYKQVCVAIAADPSLALDDPTSDATPSAEQIKTLEKNLHELVLGVVPQVKGQGEDAIHVVIRRILEAPPDPAAGTAAPSILSSPWMDLLDHLVEIAVAIGALLMFAGMLRRARKRALETRRNIEELHRPAPAIPLSPEAEARVKAESILTSNPEAASRVLREWARTGG